MRSHVGAAWTARRTLHVDALSISICWEGGKKHLLVARVALKHFRPEPGFSVVRNEQLGSADEGFEEAGIMSVAVAPAFFTILVDLRCAHPFFLIVSFNKLVPLINLPTKR